MVYRLTLRQIENSEGNPTLESIIAMAHFYNKELHVPISKIIGSLADNPRPNGCEKLSGDEKYRIRKGPYRIIYSIHGIDLVIWVVKIAHRT